MNCPNCRQGLGFGNILGIKVAPCQSCGGLWFDRDHFNQIKAAELPEANWIKVDLWREGEKFCALASDRVCPECLVKLCLVKYGDSDIQVEICSQCEGMWLDRGELAKILKYLGRTVDAEVLQHYGRDLFQEGKEIFTGPKPLGMELRDFVTLLGLFKYKLGVQHPAVTAVIRSLPK